MFRLVLFLLVWWVSLVRVVSIGLLTLSINLIIQMKWRGFVLNGSTTEPDLARTDVMLDAEWLPLSMQGELYSKGQTG